MHPYAFDLWFRSVAEKNYTYGKGHNSDSNINQQICEHVSHIASHFLLRLKSDKYIEYI